MCLHIVARAGLYYIVLLNALTASFICLLVCK